MQDFQLYLRIMLLCKSHESLKIPTESMSGVPDHPLVKLVHLRIVLGLHLPLDIMIPQLVTAPLSPTLRHGSLILTADEGSILLLDSLAVVHVVDPQVSGEGDGSCTLQMYS